VLVRADEQPADAEARAEAIAIYQKHLRPPGEVEARVGMNRYLVHPFTTWSFGRGTPATWVPGIASEWDAESGSETRHRC